MLFRPKTQQIYIFADWQNKLFFNFSNSSYGRVALSQKLVCSKNNRYEKKIENITLVSGSTLPEFNIIGYSGFY
jgi:hypothetical protein